MTDLFDSPHGLFTADGKTLPATEINERIKSLPELIKEFEEEDEDRALKKYTKQTGPPKLPPKGGNPNHDGKTGKFTSKPGGSKTKPKSAVPKKAASEPSKSVAAKQEPELGHDGKGNYKDGGGLSGNQWKAIDPESNSTAAEARAAMDSTPNGKLLKESVIGWQSDITKCVVLREDFMKAATGKRLAKAKKPAAKSLMDAIGGSPKSPPIHRGNRFETKDLDQLKAGKSIVLPPGSWTASPRVAGQFAVSKSRRQVVPVVFHVRGGARALPVEKFGRPNNKHEQEYITAGQFKITKVSKRGGVTHVEAEHTAMFSWEVAQGGNSV